MKPLTWDMVVGGLKLSKLQIRNILTNHGLPVYAPDDVVDEYALAVLLTANLLESLEFLAPEQRTLILGHLGELLRLTTENNALIQLAFCDRRYCIWTGNVGVVDLTTGDKLEVIPVQPVETISYNLNAVYLYGRIKIERRSGLHAKQQDSDGAVEEPADVCQRTPDGVS